MGPSETDRLQIAKLARNYAVMIWRSFRQGQHQEAKDNFRQFLKLRVYTETAPFLTMMKVYNATKEHYKALEVRFSLSVVLIRSEISSECFFGG